MYYLEEISLGKNPDGLKLRNKIEMLFLIYVECTKKNKCRPAYKLAG